MGSARTASFDLTGRRRGIFLDRDGVLNEALERNGKPHPPASRADVRLVPGALEAVASLREAGFVTVCVTNQPDVARGTLPLETAHDINTWVRSASGIDDLIACYHDDVAGCLCRKPRPGMLVEGAVRWEIDLASSYMVGDRWRDIEAGQAAGCRTVLIDRKWAERRSEREADAVVRTVSDAITWILADRRPFETRT